MKMAIVGFESLNEAFAGLPSSIKAYAINGTQYRALSVSETIGEAMSVTPPLVFDIAKDPISANDTQAALTRADASYIWRFIQCEMSVTLTGTAK